MAIESGLLEAGSVLSSFAQVGLGGIIVAAIFALSRSWPTIVKIKSEGDASIRASEAESRSADRARIQSLEARCDALSSKIDRLTDQHHEQLEEQRLAHAAELQVMRHQLSNETQMLDALLRQLKINPDQVQKAADMIIAERADRRRAIAIEKGAMVGRVSMNNGSSNKEEEKPKEKKD